MGAPTTAPRRRDWLGLSVLAGLMLVLVGYSLWIHRRIQSDPSVVFLAEQAGAEWIVLDAPVNLATRSGELTSGVFRLQFSAGEAPPAATLRIRALKHATVYLDGNRIAASPATAPNWKEPMAVAMPPLTPGRHELAVLVQNNLGPIALWLAAEHPALRSGPAWEARGADGTWKPARLAHARPRPALTAEFPDLAAGFAARWWFFAVVLIGTAGLMLLSRRHAPSARLAGNPAAWRWLVMSLWAALGLLSLFRLPLAAGFDVAGHVEYIEHVLNRGRVPLANEGWQLFQSPLYYGLSAPLAWLGLKIGPPETAATLLRLGPLLCGLLQIEVAFRAVRRVCPARDDLQIVAVVLAGALPMNLYLSRYVGNEPLAALLSSVAFLLCLRLVRPAAGENLRWVPLQLGVVLGLAVLTKVSAVLMGGVALVALAAQGEADGTPRFFSARRLAPFFWTAGAAFAIAGWYYVRNWIALGRPFVGGWDVSRGIVWWQEPGYRMAADFLSFGQVLSQPILAGLESMPGGLFASLWSDTFLSSAIARQAAPPWDYALLPLSVAFALVPSLLMVIGGGLVLRRARRDRVALLVLTVLAAYGVALLHHIVTLPYYCAVKATYVLGATPALVLLGVLGFEFTGRNRMLRTAFVAGLACWAASVFGTYLVRG
jgi:hypothetical protein